MLKSMMRKELRELLPFVAIALLFQFFVISLEAGMKWKPIGSWFGLDRLLNQIIPFVSPESCVGSFVVGGFLAVIIGLWQSMWESSRGTFLYLLHRPAAREAILSAKLLAGSAAFLSATAIPLFCYAIWAAIPGTHASPFEWSMTGPAWKVCCVLVLLYLGAFLSGIWPARWYVSKFWPLVTITFGVFLLGVSPWSDLWWWLQMVATILGCIALVVAIFQVARLRDFS